MDAASINTSPASKVIVQCIDPRNLFNDVAPLVQSQLPLNNLHWNSATRPLRSIDSLDVSLIREEPHDPKAVPRHQIPGLRQTPYVKVYLLRCDDKDKYRDSVRKELKDWVKSLAISTSGKTTVKGQERHDAYEYVILHVVLPGTPAAAQPKSSKRISLEASDSTDSVNSIPKSKWTGKNSSTIYDKLRADFHSSSKAPFERVAQVRLPDSTNPNAVLSPLDLEEQWQDLLEKIRTAILRSFDARVAQYEDDIREREAQRNLPGWNFCTFFILKEGLARGFENVGLLEDAMKVYEELDAGLDVVIQEQAKDEYTDTTNALLPYAADLKDTIRKALGTDIKAEENGMGAVGNNLQAWTVADSKQFPWRLERRDYQRMILTNQVSALDFRIYIFIRQIQILLRRANVPLKGSKSQPVQEAITPRWDADVLSSICERSIRFLGLAARNLRQDLFAAWGGREGLPVEERQVQSNVIENIVSSWKWSSLLQVLSECQVVMAFKDFAQDGSSDPKAGQLFDANNVSEAWKIQCRNYSIATHSSSESSSLVNGTKTKLQSGMFSAIQVVQGNKDAFIFQTAEILLMLRNIVQSLGKGHGKLPCTSFRKNQTAGLGDDLLSSDRGVLSTSLQFVLGSRETMEAAYRLLTIYACQCYLAAGKARAPRQLCYDLATFDAYSGNFDAAMAWLDSIQDTHHESHRIASGDSVSELYQSCLKETNRYEELCQNLLLSLRARTQIEPNEEKVVSIWNEITESAGKAVNVKLPFDSIFRLNRIEEYITHTSRVGGFGTWISLQLLIPIKSLGKGEISIELRTKNHSTPERLFLQYVGHLDVRHSALEALVTSSVVTEGWYTVVRLEVRIGSVCFEHHLSSDVTKMDNGEAQTPLRRPICNDIYVYPNCQAPYISMVDGQIRDLSQRRSVSMTVNRKSIDLPIPRALLRLKPATAGLRLDLQNLVSQEHGKINVIQLEDAQVVELIPLYERELHFDVPYILEDNTILAIAIRANLSYNTGEGNFEIFETLSTSCILPISVNVQDTLQSATIFSQFAFTPSRPVPTRIEDCSLSGCDRYQLTSIHPIPMPIDAFPRQPASWMAKIVDRKPSLDPLAALDNDSGQLSLEISYRCADEAILQTLQHVFVTSISETSLMHTMRPLLAYLLAKIQSIWTEQQIELAMLTGEVEMWPFDGLEWTEPLHAFDRDVRAKLTTWLRNWHETHSVIRLQIHNAPQRVLKLLVDAPRPLLMITTSYLFKHKQLSYDNCQIGQGVLGQPLPMKLGIASKCSSQIVDDPIEISMELTNQQDTWLIGGIRKIAFDLSQQFLECDIILVPQKAGSLILPLLEVKCWRRDDNTPIIVEVEHLDCVTTVDVREDVQLVTLGIGDGESSEGYWLVNGQSRL